MKTLGKVSDVPGPTSDQEGLTFPIFQIDFYKRMQFRVKNTVVSGKKGENQSDQASNLVHSGPPPVLERNTAVDLHFRCFRRENRDFS